MEKKLLLIVDVQRGFVNEYTKPYLKKIELFVKILNWNKMRTSNEQQLAIDVDGATIINKNTYDGVNYELVKYIKKHDIQEVHIIGFDTDTSVLSTAMSIFDLMGIRPLVYRDLCFSTEGFEAHDRAIKLLQRSIGFEQVI